MSDNNFFQRSINVDGNSSQSVSAAGDIGSGTTVVAADTTAAAYTVSLPDQVGAAGQTITEWLGQIGDRAQPQTGDSMAGVVDATAAIAAGTAYASLTFVSTGSSWASV